MAISMEDCAFYGLDPRTATEATLAAVKQQDYEQMLKRARTRERKLNATKRSEFQEVKICARRAQRRSLQALAVQNHHRICKVLGLDPNRVSRERAIEMHKNRIFTRTMLADLVFLRRTGAVY